MRNPFRPQDHPKNPTPGTQGTDSGTSDPDKTGGRLSRALKGKMPENPTPRKETPVTGRRMGESSSDWRRRQGTGIDRHGRST
ncbi:hypothetical protein ACIRPH_17345 [Nocardiopsis sp. NPDC101807]|uniref:hypothetical protein n=1 Tax=Nocardiopsis sp. NPDC101807 TaxID=3364339 RepID=UPI0038119C0D